MSQTQSFPKPMWHLDKSRHFILLSQPYSQCLAFQAKMLTTRKLQKAQQATLKEWKLYFSKEALQVLLGTHLLCQLGSSVVFGWCLGQMRVSTIQRHQWNSLEPWRVPYKSRRFQNTLHNSMYKNIQEISRFLQKALAFSHVFHHSVEMCGHLQASLEPCILFPPMTQCRWLQEFLEASQALQKPMGRII